MTILDLIAAGRAMLVGQGVPQILTSGQTAPSGGGGSSATITVTTPSAWISGQTVTLSGAYTGTAPTGVLVGFDGAAPSIALSSFGATGGAWSGQLTAPASGTHTISVQETNASGVTASSGSFPVASSGGSSNGGPGQPLSAAPALTGIAFATWPVSVGTQLSGRYDGWGVGVASAIGGVGPYFYAMSDPLNVLHIQPLTGQIAVNYGHAVVLSAGNYKISVTVTDALGTSLTNSFTIDVVNSNQVAFSGNIIASNAASTNYAILYAAHDTAGNTIYPASGKATVSDPSGIFTDIGYNQIGPANGKLPPVGSYPITVSVTNGSETATTPITLQVIEELIANIYFTPTTLSSATPSGSVVGTAYAADQDNTYSWSLAAGSSSLFSINSQSGVISTTGSLTAGETYNLNITCADLSLSLTQSFQVTPVAGVILPASAMTATVATNLTNFVQNFSTNIRTVITPKLPSGITGTPVWSITNNNNVCPNYTQYGLNGPLGTLAPEHQRYEIDATTGLVTTRAQLSAQTDSVAITVTDRINTCTQTFSIVVTAVVGPTVFIGQGMSTTYPAGSNNAPVVTSAYPNGVVGFEHFLTIYELMQQGNAPNATFAGATIIIQPNSDPNYYANDTYDASDAARFGMFGPATIKGASTTNLARLGGIVGSNYSGLDATGIGSLVLNHGDFTIQNLEVSWVHGIPYLEGSTPNNDNQVGTAIAKRGVTWGNLTIDNCYVHSSDQGIAAGDTTGTVSITNTEVTNCGGCYQGAGATHNIYVDGAWLLSMTNVLSWKCNNGHTLKSRSMNGQYTKCRLFDTERGSASKQADICDGGVHTFSNCVLQKGAMLQNPYSVAFCAETTSHSYGVNTLLVENCTLINDCETPGNAAAIQMSPMQSPISGQFDSTTSLNNSFWGYNGFANQADTAISLPHNTADLGSTGTYDPNAAITETGSIQLTARPTLDLTHPGSAAWTGIARPGPYYFVFDGNLTNYYWEYIGGVQIDPGFDDINVSVSAPVGTVIANCTATGCLYYAGSALNTTTPQATDIRVNPFTSGTTWSLVSNAHSYGGNNASSTYAVAPSGRYAINATTGVVTVAGPLVAGVDHIVVQAQAPSTSVNAYTQTPPICQWMLYINVTA